MSNKVIIIGAGLSGLTSAFILKQKGISSLILEARSRVGGRIHTEKEDNFHCEMGATWLGPQHTVLVSLFDQLNLPKFNQNYDGKGIVFYGSEHPPYMFESNPNDPPTFRIEQGSGALIDRLLEEAQPQIILGERVHTISETDDLLIIETDEKRYETKHLISTIPPKLTAKSIDFQPRLTDDLMLQMEETHTWMSNSIKFAIYYDRPFWRDRDLSGALMSPNGPVIEMYDHTTADNSAFGLMGFLSESLRVFDQEKRKKIVLEFISQFMGEEALLCRKYYDKDWSVDTLTTTADFVSVQQHPVYRNELFQKEYMGGRLIFSGTETSPHYAGYMEGAVYAGIRSAQQVLNYNGVAAAE